MKHIKFIIPVFLLASLLLACDSSSDGDGDDNPGTFTITVTGDHSESFEGTGTFAGGTDGTSSGFGVFLAGTTGGQVITILKNTQSRPSNGTYQIRNADDDFDDLAEDEYVASYISTSGSVAITGLSVSGTVRITDSSDTKVAGTVNFTATGNSVNTSTGAVEQVTVTISGSFSAISGFFQGL